MSGPPGSVSAQPAPDWSKASTPFDRDVQPLGRRLVKLESGRDSRGDRVPEGPQPSHDR